MKFTSKTRSFLALVALEVIAGGSFAIAQTADDAQKKKAAEAAAAQMKAKAEQDAAALKAVQQATANAKTVQWVQGATPSSLVVGHPFNSKPMHVCRAMMADNAMHAGVAWDGTCYVGYYGKSVNSKLGETLVVKAHSWVAPKSAGEVPADVVTVSTLAGAPIHVCRGLDPDKKLRPGKAYKGNCFLAHGGNEIVLSTFEFLVVPGQK